MRFRVLFFIVGLLTVVASQQVPVQGGICGIPAPWCAPLCVPAAVPACPSPPAAVTVCTPKVVVENHTRIVTRYRPEIRQRTAVVYRDVPETKTIEEQYTVMVPEVRTRTVLDTVNRPVYRDIELRKTAMVARTEARQSTRTVCRMVPVQEQRTVCEVINRCAAALAVRPPATPAVTEPQAPLATPTLLHTAVYRKVTVSDNAVVPPPLDNSQSQQLPGESQVGPPPPPPTATPPATVAPAAPAPGPVVGSACETCGQSACCVAEVVPRTVTLTCLRPTYQQETIEYPVTSLQPNVRNQTVSFYEYQPEQVPRKEQYTVEVPQTRVRTKEVTVMRSVPVEQQEQYTVMVPYQEHIQVPVVRYVPETVTVPLAPSCGPCAW